MKAYSLDLRQRIVAHVQNGGGKMEAARRFGVGCDTVYRYLRAEAAGTLAPKTSWGHWRKLDPEKLAEHVQTHADDTLVEMGKRFGVGKDCVGNALKKMGCTRKKKTPCTASGTNLIVGSSCASWNA